MPNAERFFLSDQAALTLFKLENYQPDWKRVATMLASQEFFWDYKGDLLGLLAEHWLRLGLEEIVAVEHNLV